MEPFSECRLLLQPYPSLPSEDGLASGYKPKVRRILKAKRCLKKGTESKNTSKVLKKLSKSPEVSHSAIMAIRAINKRKSNKNVAAKFNDSPSDGSFLENDLLCDVAQKTTALKEVKYEFKKKFNKQKIRPSDVSFMENERLCAIDSDDNKEFLQLSQSAATFKTPNFTKPPFMPKPVLNLPEIFQVSSDIGEIPKTLKSAVYSSPETPIFRKTPFKPKPRLNFQLSNNTSSGNEINCGITYRRTPFKLKPIPKLPGLFQLPINIEKNCCNKDESNITSVINSSTKILNARQTPFKPKPMPNFAKIFQDQAGKVENIAEYKKRTADRAAKLLSGTKPTQIPKLTKITQIPKMKKQLTFTIKNSPNLQKIPGYINVESISPHPRRKATKCNPLNHESKDEDDLSMKFTFDQVNNIKKSFEKTKMGEASLKIRDNPVKYTINAENNDVTERSELNKDSLIKINVKVHEKIKKPIKKDDLVKAFQRRTQRPDGDPIKSQRRHDIKGVRLNRRFELLMQMRADKSDNK